MSNIVKWDCDFSATLISNNEIISNSFNLEIDFNCLVDDDMIQIIGFERLKYFVYDILHNSVMLARNHKLFKQFVKTIISNIVTFPFDPDDQIILWCIYKKLTKILDKNFVINELRIKSILGDRIQYSFDGNNNGIEYLDDKWSDSKISYDYWYNRSDMSTYDLMVLDKKIRKLYTGRETWEGLNLEWQTETEFVKKMKKTAKQEAKIIRPKKFQIQIIDGKNENR